MTTPEFLSKVHLPSFCHQLGLGVGMTFKKIPKFGWFAWDAARDRASTIFDFLPGSTAVSDAYRLATIEHPAWQDSRMWFSANSLAKLQNHHLKWQTIHELHRRAVVELNSNAMYRPPGSTERIRFNRWAESVGFLAFAQRAQVGLVSERVVASIVETLPRDMHRNVAELKGQLVVPSFVAPGRICTLNTLNPTSMHVKEVYRMVEPGWFGQLNVRVHQHLPDLLEQAGCTWDSKVPYWTTQAVALSDRLTPATGIEIWSSTEPLLCTSSPIELVKRATEAERTALFTGKLSLAQVIELEQQTGEKLQQLWRTNRDSIVEVCGTEFGVDGDRYCIVKHRQLIEYTNFTMRLTKIVKEGDRYQQHGFLYHKGQELAFTMERRHFETFNRLLRALSRLFLDSGLGVPMVAPNYKHYLTNVIHAFNPDITIENAQPAAALKAPEATVCTTV